MDTHPSEYKQHRVYKYLFGDKQYEVDKSLIPEDSLLAVIYRNAVSRSQDIALITDPNIEYVLWYIENTPFVSYKQAIIILDYWGVYRSYDKIRNEEEFMRANMHSDSYSQHKMNTDQYFRLTNMNLFRDEYRIFTESYTKPEGLLVNMYLLAIGLPALDFSVPSSDILVQRLHGLDFLFESAKANNIDIIIAGQHIFKVLTGLGGTFEDMPETSPLNFHTSTVEIDIFILESNPQYIANYINTIGSLIENMYEGYHEYQSDDHIEQAFISAYIMREAYNEDPYDNYNKYSSPDKIRSVGSAWVVCSRNKDMIIIRALTNEDTLLRINIKLKMYKTYSEVLHGFDLDSDCVGWDGVDVWATERGKYALSHGYETLNNISISNYYMRMLETRAKFGMDIDLSLANKRLTQQDLPEVVTFIEQLTSTLTPRMKTYTKPNYSLDYTEPYEYGIDRLVMKRDASIIDPLIDILRADGMKKL